jgi:hypothetical protein
MTATAVLQSQCVTSGRHSSSLQGSSSIGLNEVFGVHDTRRQRAGNLHASARVRGELEIADCPGLHPPHL